MTVEGQRSRQPKPLAAGAFQGTICSFRLHLAAEGKSAKTVRMYAEAVQWFAAAHLLRETSRTDWDQVCAQDIQCWMVWLLGRYSDSYASNQYRALQQFFRWWSDEEELPDPMARLRPPRVSQKLVPVFTSGELSALERACQGRTFAQRRDSAIIAVFRATGIRLSELAGIRYDPDDRCAAMLTCGTGRSWSAARAARRGSSGSAMRPPAVSTGTSGFAPGMSRRTGRSCGWE
jgi:site-specific recombinase XerD